MVITCNIAHKGSNVPDSFTGPLAKKFGIGGLKVFGLGRGKTPQVFTVKGPQITFLIARKTEGMGVRTVNTCRARLAHAIHGQDEACQKLTKIPTKTKVRDAKMKSKDEPKRELSSSRENNCSSTV